MFSRNCTYLINHKNTMHITKSNQNTADALDLNSMHNTKIKINDIVQK